MNNIDQLEEAFAEVSAVTKVATPIRTGPDSMLLMVHGWGIKLLDNGHWYLEDTAD